MHSMFCQFLIIIHMSSSGIQFSSILNMSCCRPTPQSSPSLVFVKLSALGGLNLTSSRRILESAGKWIVRQKSLTFPKAFFIGNLTRLYPRLDHNLVLARTVSVRLSKLVGRHSATHFLIKFGLSSAEFFFTTNNKVNVFCGPTWSCFLLLFKCLLLLTLTERLFLSFER